MILSNKAKIYPFWKGQGKTSCKEVSLTGSLTIPLSSGALSSATESNNKKKVEEEKYEGKIY